MLGFSGQHNWCHPTSDLLGMRVEAVDLVCAREAQPISVSSELRQIRQEAICTAARVALLEEKLSRGS